MRALILCAGRGERLKPLTDETPKPMIEVGGKPVLAHLVDHLKKYEIEDIMVNIHYKPDKIMDYFGDKLIYIHEPILLGDLASTKRIKNLIDDDIIVMNGDTMTNINLYQMRSDSHTEDTSVASFDGMTYTGTTFLINTSITK